VCQGCSEFRDEVRRQRAMLAVALPVLPSLALKRSVLAAAGIGSGGAGAGGVGLAGGVAVKGGIAKLVAIGALGTAAVGGGVALEESGTLTPGHSSPATRPAAHLSGVGSRVSGVVRKTIVAPTHAPTTGSPASRTRHPAFHTRHPASHTRHSKPAKHHAQHAPNNAVGKLHSQLKSENGKRHAYGHTKAPAAKAPAAKPPAPPKTKPLKAKSKTPPKPSKPEIPDPAARKNGTPPGLTEH
jgi:hypothetical protein